MNSKQFIISTVSTIVKLVVAVILVMFVYRWAHTAYDFGYRVFTEEPVSSAPGISYTVTLTEETSAGQVGEALEDYGLIRDSRLFYIQYFMSEYKDEFVPGTYQLNTSQTAEEMMAVLSQAEGTETSEETEDYPVQAEEPGEEAAEDDALEETTEE